MQLDPSYTLMKVRKMQYNDLGHGTANNEDSDNDSDGDDYEDDLIDH